MSFVYLNLNTFKFRQQNDILFRTEGVLNKKLLESQGNLVFLSNCLTPLTKITIGNVRRQLSWKLRRKNPHTKEIATKPLEDPPNVQRVD